MFRPLSAQERCDPCLAVARYLLQGVSHICQHLLMVFNHSFSAMSKGATHTSFRVFRVKYVTAVALSECGLKALDFHSFPFVFS